jgi:hypothetical protein
MVIITKNSDGSAEATPSTHGGFALCRSRRDDDSCLPIARRAGSPEEVLNCYHGLYLAHRPQCWLPIHRPSYAYRH